MDLKQYLEEKRVEVDRALNRYFPEKGQIDSSLNDAMRYSLFAGGKRLRPILCLAGADAVGGNGSKTLPVACALEMIHTYSLIHDDLPVMDDDDLRRGKPANHKMFGDAMALLAGDGLLTEAFVLMCRAGLSGETHPSVLISVIHLIAQAAGCQGMVAGQAVDITTEGRPVDLAIVEFIHKKKTAALITASVVAGVMLGGGDDVQRKATAEYGQNVGLAFQISDDLLDIEGETAVLGKRVGVDDLKGKMTYPSVVGLEQAKAVQAGLIKNAIEALKEFDNRADPLREMAHYIITRKR
jgi:geranylgeranyl diphosphate synthase type II